MTDTRDEMVKRLRSNAFAGMETMRDFALGIVESDAKRIAELEATLRQHHNWHLQVGAIGLQDGEGGWIEIDGAAEYSDSAMYERTEKLLAHAAPEELQPMPRGGFSTWWWEQAVLLRRKVRRAEAALTEARRERDEAHERCAKIAEQTAVEFLSPQYASNQPLGSFNERFACEHVAAAIRAGNKEG